MTLIMLAWRDESRGLVPATTLTVSNAYAIFVLWSTRREPTLRTVEREAALPNKA